MARIRIYLDGTFEATAGKYSFATDKERRDRIKVLQGDLKIMDKVEKLRVDRERNKKTIATLKGPQKEKARAKDKEFLGKIKDLKAKLTSPRHSSSKIIGGMIRQTMDTVVGGKTIGQIAKEAGIKPATVGRKLKPTRNDPGKGIRRDATKERLQNKITALETKLAKVPKIKAARYDNKRADIQIEIEAAQDELKALSKKPGKAPSTSPAGKAALRKQIAREAPALKKAFAEIDRKAAIPKK